MIDCSIKQYKVEIKDIMGFWQVYRGCGNNPNQRNCFLDIQDLKSAPLSLQGGDNIVARVTARNEAGQSEVSM
jgi:hypothetical protein